MAPVQSVDPHFRLETAARMKKQAIVVRKGKSSSGVPPLSSPEQSRDGSATLQSQSGSGVPPLSSDTNKRRDAASTLHNTPKYTLSHNVAQEGTWPVVSIGEVVAINPRPSDDTLADDALASFIPMKCVEEESGRFEPLSDRKVADVRKGYTPFRDGDVLFAKVTPCMENGKGAVMKGLTNGIGFGSTEFFALRPADCLDAAYLFHFVLQSSFRQQAARNMTGAVGLRRVPKSYLEQQPIPLPPLPEQRRIVAEIEKQFTRLEAGVSALKRVQANLKRYRAAVLKAACEGKLVPTEAELQKSGSGVSPLKQSRDGSATFETGEQLLKRILSERRKNWTGRGQYKEPTSQDSDMQQPIPVGWTMCSVGQVSECLDGRRVPINKAERAKRQGDVPYYGANGQVGSIDTHLFDEPLVLVVEDETFTGRTQAFSYVIKGKTWVNNHAHVLRATSAVSTAYLNYSLAHYPFTARTTGSTGRRKLTQKALMAAPYLLPPLAEQTRIVAEVERRLSVAEELEAMVSANLQRATRLRQAILQKAFTGRLINQGN
jgi:type I restriction enzyme S subunit